MVELGERRAKKTREGRRLLTIPLLWVYEIQNPLPQQRQFLLLQMYSQYRIEMNEFQFELLTEFGEVGCGGIGRRGLGAVTWFEKSPVASRGDKVWSSNK